MTAATTRSLVARFSTRVEKPVSSSAISLASSSISVSPFYTPPSPTNYSNPPPFLQMSVSSSGDTSTSSRTNKPTDTTLISRKASHTIPSKALRAIEAYWTPNIDCNAESFLHNRMYFSLHYQICAPSSFSFPNRVRAFFSSGISRLGIYRSLSLAIPLACSGSLSLRCPRCWWRKRSVHEGDDGAHVECAIGDCRQKPQRKNSREGGE